MSHQRVWITPGIIGVEVDTTHGPVTFVNTHLQAQRKHAKIRRAQLDEILEATDAVRTPLVLSGDFNLFDDHAEDRAGHAALERHGFRDASLLVDRPHPTYLAKNPYVSEPTDYRFDRIYLRDGVHRGKAVRIAAERVEVIVDHRAPFSDHEAVAARLRLST